MIDYGAISCSSGLYDSCGVVFRHDERIFRALYSRGDNLFQMLTQDSWIDKLTDLGLIPMKRADVAIPGYDSVIECDRVRPVISRSMWTTGMVREAGLTLCALSKELLRRHLVIWDLKNLSNMAYSARRGPVFLDLGAIHTIEEIENRRLSTSVRSLLDQIAAALYIPVWLAYGTPMKLRVAKRLLEFLKAGEPASDLAAGIIRRLTIRWMAVPGLFRARRLLQAGHYAAFFDLIENRIARWTDSSAIGSRSLDPATSQPGPAGRNLDNIVGTIKNVLANLDDKILFDLNPEYGFGLNQGMKTTAETYLITADVEIANRSFSLRQHHGKAFLPVLCDIWERSFQPASMLRDGCDVAFLLPDVYEVATSAKVPLDFVGLVLSSITRSSAVIGVGRFPRKSQFPAFVSPPEDSLDPMQFVRQTVGKYFRKHEVIDAPKDWEIDVAVFSK